jgi:hypothetical protein
MIYYATYICSGGIANGFRFVAFSSAAEGGYYYDLSITNAEMLL